MESCSLGNESHHGDHSPILALPANNLSTCLPCSTPSPRRSGRGTEGHSKEALAQDEVFEGTTSKGGERSCGVTHPLCAWLGSKECAGGARNVGSQARAPCLRGNVSSSALQGTEQRAQLLETSSGKWPKPGQSLAAAPCWNWGPGLLTWESTFSLQLPPLPHA